jgi:predicted O-methyltransferase YrrM
MTAEQHLAQNVAGFESDSILKAHFETLIAKHGIDTIIETGTYMGATTLQFASMVPHVYTIEANKEYHDQAKAKFEGKNIESFLGSSADILDKVIAKMPITKKMLFFLDAHWGPNNPLLKELQIIGNAKIKPVIAIHDFKVPGHPELGFDSYDGQDYEWDWIAASIDALYGTGNYTYHYNTTAEGASRGVIFIEPK